MLVRVEWKWPRIDSKADRKRCAWPTDLNRPIRVLSFELDDVSFLLDYSSPYAVYVLTPLRDVLFSRAATLELVGDDDSRNEASRFEQFAKKSVCSRCVASVLHQDIKHYDVD